MAKVEVRVLIIGLIGVVKALRLIFGALFGL